MRQEPGKHVLVWGLGITGFESARVLKQRGHEVTVWDQALNPVLQTRGHALSSMGIRVLLDHADCPDLKDVDWVLISPGVRPSATAAGPIFQARLPVYSEIETASWYCPSRRIIAITGSAGKTTVSTLTAELIRSLGFEAVLCGNIGQPWIGILDKIKPETFVVLELSSFQLKFCSKFSPEIGVLLNISPNHLDWHADMPDYVASKLNMFRARSAAHFAVLRKQDQDRYFPEVAFKSKRIYFDQMTAKTELSDNYRALLAIASVYGWEEKAVRSVFREFRGLPHRLEYAGEYDGIRFVNDSKCTTPLSLKWALNSFENKTVHLIAGGRAKSHDFELLNDELQKKVKQIILIGEAAPMLEKCWRECGRIVNAESLPAALKAAVQGATPGDTVLLSPGCASFDMFSNYLERGDVFKQCVADYKAALKGSPSVSGVK
ncbi:MAG: UDP-N-acetylmuramoylalanine--D-glutamate ligase [Omnitrophica bacterium GWA2_52_8]|nr:MAG: UDP-N-acetylmuramoylalanine--D-glutamate ligase [Omnitrophica bacterium GWA2_52_8]